MFIIFCKASKFQCYNINKGYYEIVELNEAIQKEVRTIIQKLQATYYKSIIRCSHEVNLNIENMLASILGFSTDKF